MRDLSVEGARAATGSGAAAGNAINSSIGIRSFMFGLPFAAEALAGPCQHTFYRLLGPAEDCSDFGSGFLIPVLPLEQQSMWFRQLIQNSDDLLAEAVLVESGIEVCRAVGESDGLFKIRWTHAGAVIVLDLVAGDT